MINHIKIEERVHEISTGRCEAIVFNNFPHKMSQKIKWQHAGADPGCLERGFKFTKGFLFS